jgi:hypothetical protein
VLFGSRARGDAEPLRRNRNPGAFLQQTYNLKAIADYETGPGSEVTAERAASALEAARKFISHVTGLM